MFQLTTSSSNLGEGCDHSGYGCSSSSFSPDNQEDQDFYSCSSRSVRGKNLRRSSSDSPHSLRLAIILMLVGRAPPQNERAHLDIAPGRAALPRRRGVQSRFARRGGQTGRFALPRSGSVSRCAQNERTRTLQLALPPVLIWCANRQPRQFSREIFLARAIWNFSRPARFRRVSPGGSWIRKLRGARFRFFRVSARSFPARMFLARRNPVLESIQQLRWKRVSPA